MKLTDALLGEPGVFHVLFDLIQDMAGTDEAMARIRGAVTVLTAMVDSHATLEDRLLFTALEPHLGRDAVPLAQMRAEHEQMERRLEAIEEVDDVNAALARIEEALALARLHFQKEERVLFPMAERILGPVALSRLGEAWAESRRVKL